MSSAAASISSSSALAESYSAFLPDVESSSTTAWSLPTYSALSVALQFSIDTISSFDRTASIDTARSRMSYNTKLVAWNGLSERQFILIPLAVPEAPAIFDFAFLDTCGFIILATKGLPTEVLTHGIMIGTYGDHNFEGIALGENVCFSTPGHFLVASGDLISRCSQLQLELSQRAEDAAGTFTKRQRLLQGATGVQAASSPGERQGTWIADPEGGQHPTRIKLDLSIREQNLAVAFRVTDRSRWPILMGSEYLLNTADYLDTVHEQYATVDRLRSSGYNSCGLLDRLGGINICKDWKALEKLMKGLFGGSNGDSLTLGDFSTIGRIPTGDSPCTEHNRILASSLRNFELSLSVFFSGEFYGSLAPFINSLEGVTRPLELIPAGFLLHLVEVTISRYFRKLRTEKQNDALKDPPSCSRYLSACFADLLEENNSPAKSYESLLRYNLHCRSGGKVVNQAATTPKVDKAAVGVCGFHLVNFFKVKRPNGDVYTCTSSNCPKKHPNVQKMTPILLAATVEKLPSHLKALCKAAMAKK